jgi:hypothetical protein
MKAERLPYDMGNAGDFIKHGLIAEFTEWWLSINKSDFVFIDPFGGRPYVSPPHTGVIRRLQQLPDCALKRGQPEIANRYFGSAKLVKNISTKVKRNVIIKVSDRNQKAMEDLLNEGFEPIQFDGFDSKNSFSIVDCKLSKHEISLLLLDPFDDFLSQYADSVIPRLAEIVSTWRVPVLVFVLCEDWESEAGLKWQQLQDRFLLPDLMQFSLACQKISNSMIEGETNLNSEAVLLLPYGYGEGHLDQLFNQLQKFSVNLSHVLERDVVFKSRGELSMEQV